MSYALLVEISFRMYGCMLNDSSSRAKECSSEPDISTDPLGGYCCWLLKYSQQSILP